MTKCHVIQDHQQYHPLLGRVDFLSETGKLGYTCFERKIAEMTLSINQDRYASIGYTAAEALSGRLVRHVVLASVPCHRFSFACQKY